MSCLATERPESCPERRPSDRKPQSLSAHVTLDTYDPDVDKALPEASRLGDCNRAGVALAMRGNPNALNESGNSPLIPASGGGHSELIQMLISNGAEVNLPEAGCRSALAAGAAIGSLAALKILLENGALVDAADADGRTPLFEARLWGHSEVAEELLKRGAHIGARNNRGNSPLAKAVFAGHVNIVKMLLDHGAEVPSGSPMIEKAMSRGCSEIVELLANADIRQRYSPGDSLEQS